MGIETMLAVYEALNVWDVPDLCTKETHECSAERSIEQHIDRVGCVPARAALSLPRY
jgi:hypothetical protein